MPQPEWFSELSVEAEELDPHSTLNLYRKALRLRRELQTAEDLEWIETGRGDVLAFARPNGWRVGVLHLGAAGAALGTTLAQTLSVIISLLMTKKKKLGIRLCRQDFIPSRSVLSEILKIGIPVAIQDGCIQIAFIIITVIANSRGLNDAAAVGIVEKVISALFIVPSSMLATVSALAAQNIGAGKHDRASKTLKYAILITFTYGIIVAIIGELITAGIVGIFTKDAAVVVLGSQYLRGYIVDCALAGIHFCFSGYFCAYGKSYIGFIHNMIAIICLRVPGSYLASKFFADTLFPMGLAAPAGSMLSVIICVGAFVWMKKHGRLGDSLRAFSSSP